MTLNDAPKIKNPWQRLKGETDTAYHRFMTYLEMGHDRSISKVAEKLQKGNRYDNVLKRWSSKHNWVERVKAYDAAQYKKNLENREELINKAHGRLLLQLDKALDVYDEILSLDDVISVEKNATTVINEKIRVAKEILDRLGVDFSAPKSFSQNPETPTYKMINDYYYNKIHQIDDN